jgi:hypothetical protein
MEKQLGTRHRSVHRRFWLFVVAALLFASSVFAAPVARVEFAVGNVSALGVDGRVRALVKGAALEEGDTVNTNEGRVQFRFTDDGFVSLYMRTVFRIDQYRWSGVYEGSERSFFSLIEGGVRTITGKLAKHNRNAYKMTTTLATVGIRGTKFTMQLNGGLSGSVAEGEIEVCNARGCIAVPAGQAYFVPDANTKPFLSNKQTYLPPVSPLGKTTLTGDTASTAGTGVIGLTQDLTGAAGAALSGTASTFSGTTSGLRAPPAGGLIQPVTGATGALTGWILGTNPLLGTIKLGY